MKRIPKIVHYVFGMASDFGGKPWSLVHHACLKSTVERIRPEKIFLYYEFEPTGPWWTLSRELITPVKIDAPLEVFGRPLSHVAHRSDVVRLQKLIEHGGIYLDADVLVQRSFDDLLDYSTVLGQEGVGGEFGAANAIILAEPNASFLRRWLNEYRSFRGEGKDHFWNEHSVNLPSKLAKQYPDEITILSERAFFWPLWTEDHLDWIFNSTRPIPLGETYANHLWEAQAWRFMEDLTPKEVLSRDTNFHFWLRPFIIGLPGTLGAPSMTRRVQKVINRMITNVQINLGRLQRRLGRLAIRAARVLFTSKQHRRRQVFQDVYKYKLWGGDSTSKFFSGVGSRGDAVEIYVEHMVELLQNHAGELGRRLTIVDLGCGDFQVGRALLSRLPDITYIGCDIVPELVAHNTEKYAEEHVSFRQVDIVCDPLPEGDVCLVRQVLQHLSNADIASFLQHMHYKHIYVTEGHPAERTGLINPDKTAGADVRFDWRTGRGRGVELDQPPFCLKTQEVFRAFAPPHEVIITERVIPVVAPSSDVDS